MPHGFTLRIVDYLQFTSVSDVVISCRCNCAGDVTVSLVLNRPMDTDKWRLFISKRKVEGRHVDADLSTNHHIIKYNWVEPSARKWQGRPPRVEVEVDEEHAFVLRVTLTANRHKTSISTDQLQTLFLDGLVAAEVFVEDGPAPPSGHPRGPSRPPS